jgi:hypothetical protein
MIEGEIGMPGSDGLLQDAIANEFGVYYHGDEMPVATSDSFVRDELSELTTDSAKRLKHAVGEDSAAELAALLRAAADDPSHSLIRLISQRTDIGWEDEKETWKVLQQLLRQIADSVDSVRANG